MQTMTLGTPVRFLPLTFIAGLAVAAALLAYDGSPLGPAPAEAATFVVNVDDDPETGGCDVASCTLREAIVAANATLADDEITFAAGITDIQLDPAVGQLTVDDVTTAGTLTIDGGAGVTVRRDTTGAQHRIFLVDGGDLDLIAITVTGGSLEEDSGGGIYNDGGNVTLTNSTVSDNEAGDDGGGIFNFFGNVTLTNSTVSGNEAAVDGGGIFNTGTVTLTNSTVSGNENSDDGGGIFNGGGNVTLTNSTVSGNTANAVDVSSGFGGGINNIGGTLTLTNSTVSGNEAANGGAGIFNFEGTVTLTNTIVAGNPIGGDCSGTFTSGGNNLDSDGTCIDDGVNNDITAADPLLGPLQDNGGPTETHALLAGSAALDNGDNGVCAGADPPVNGVDQRGVPRPDGTGGAGDCDIGAYERVVGADLAVDMTCAPLQAAPGTQVTCKIDVTNEGFIPSATLSLQTPPHTTFVSLQAPPPWVCDTPDPGATGAIVCDPDLDPDSTFAFTLVLQVDAGTPAGTQITVEVTADSPDPDIDSVSATQLVTVGAGGLSVTKVCVGEGFEASFAVAIDGVAAQAIACGQTLPFPDLEPGEHTLSETISGPDAAGFATAIVCGDAAPVAGTSAAVSGGFCVVVNVFEADADVLPLICFICSLDLEIDIGNENTNTIGIDNENTNNNANDNSNTNGNANLNDNENANRNENAQDQSNEQGQENANDQTNNIDSSPEVNIDFE